MSGLVCGYHHRIPGSLLDRRIATEVHGRYLLQVPPAAWRGALLVGFHGYAETADAQLERLRGIPGVSSWMLASVQGLHAFYRGRTEEVVASWMTRFDRERTIDDNIRFVNAVLDEIGREHGVERRVFAGFSQGVAMAFRAALRGAHRAATVIALGGDVPPELRTLAPEAWHGLRVLIGRGASDPWYTESVMAADTGFLRSCAVDVRSFVFEGGHEWAAEFSVEAGRLLAEILRSTSSG